MTTMNRRTALAATGGLLLSGAAGAWLTLGRGSSGSPTRGRGRWTSFGTVTVLGADRLAGGAAHHATTHVHTVVDAGTLAVHDPWRDTVVVDVEVHNGGREPLLVSPGQFRLRVGDGPTVSLYDSDRPPGPVPAGSTTRMRISYLAPPPGDELTVEFTEAGAVSGLRVGRVEARRERNGVMS
jgi:hypothetical protein